MRTASQIVAALKVCGKMRDLEGGKKLHLDAVASSLDKDTYVAANLITMYSKCGSMTFAQQVFDSMIHRNIFAWNCLILGYVQNGEGLVAMDLFCAMDCKPNSVTYVAALKACASLASQKDNCQKHLFVQRGIAIHKQLRNAGFEAESFVANSLVDMYSKCGNIDLAKEVFDRISCKNKSVVTWTCLILGYVHNGQSIAALDLFSVMDCEPNPVTYVAALKACGELGSEDESKKYFCLEKGSAIHKRVLEAGFESDVFVASTLVDMYSKCGSMDRARAVFDRMSSKNVVTWNCLIQGYVQNGESLVAMELFREMDCEPNPITYVAVLKALASATEEAAGSDKQFILEKGIALHKQINCHGFYANLSVTNTLVDMYCKCGSMDRAKDVFDRMKVKNVVTWTFLIQGSFQNGENRAALGLFNSMDCEPDPFTYVAVLKACGGLAAISEKASDKQIWLEKGMSIHKQLKELEFESDMFVASSLVDMYSKCGSMDRAREVFDRMRLKNVVNWTCLLQGYVQNGAYLEAMEVFRAMEMDSKVEPNCVTYAVALKACAGLAALEAGQEIHASICRHGLEQDRVVATSLMDLYAKCGGCVNRVESLFINMNSPGIVSWNAVIAGYSCLGDSYRVLNLVQQMREAGVQMDSVTSICVLATCSRAGLVDEGKAFFKSMMSGNENLKVPVTVEHYTCMIDMLGKANRLEEALALAGGMPVEMAKDGVVWRCLLGACWKWRNVEVGKAAFDALVCAEKIDAAGYVLMRDIYASLRMWEEMEQVVSQAAGL